MKGDETQGIMHLTLIAGRKQKDALTAALLQHSAKLVNVSYGEGTVKVSFLQNAFGLVPEENKVVITCLASHDRCDGILAMLEEQFHFNKPNTGIAFTIPVEKLSF